MDNPVEDLEPEAAGIASDSSFALVTIQDSSSVAAVDLTAIATGELMNLTPVSKQGQLRPFGIAGTMMVRFEKHVGTCRYASQQIIYS